MSTTTKPKTKKNREKPRKDDIKVKSNSSTLAEDSNQDPINPLQIGLDGISQQISTMQSELKADLKMFKEEITSHMRSELSQFKEDMDQKLAIITKDSQEQNERMDAVLTRTEEVEAWSTGANEVLQELLHERNRMKDKLDDLESRSRRNNLRIYGIPEDTETTSVLSFVEEWLRTELSIERDLQIQRAHRALAKKPKAEEPPRSLVVNFLQYTEKELVLSKAWKKKNITLGDNRIYFDHDYSAGVLQKRKAYANVKKVLKNQGIRFQTPFTKMRIHWTNGQKTYNTAEEATEDLRKRGIEVESPAYQNGPPQLEQLLSSKTAAWQRVGRDGIAETRQRTRQKLREFQHDSNERRQGEND